MKVFLSWSGDTSREIAAEFREWLPLVIQVAEPFFSTDDIDKGARWSLDIASELDSCNIGLIFLTKQNLDAPWIMFEAGALSKKLGSGKVIPILFGIEPSDLRGPLVQFQAARFSKGEMRQLLDTLNRVVSPPLSTLVLDQVFEKWWPELEAKVTPKLQQEMFSQPEPVRKDRDIMNEVLETVRSIASRPPSDVEQFEQKRKDLKHECIRLEIEVDLLETKKVEIESELENLETEIEESNEELDRVKGEIHKAMNRLSDWEEGNDSVIS